MSQSAPMRSRHKFRGAEFRLPRHHQADISPTLGDSPLAALEAFESFAALARGRIT